MTEAVHGPKAVAFNKGADHADEDRRHDERRPEPDKGANLIGEIRPQHKKAGMGEIEHAHHRENQREPAGQHEQQHAVEHPVEQGED